ncbi:MAG: histidinol dehydrogenase [Acidobacteriota bacterium]|nr:histidinol dehydrogenase [Acidobacteriota bacterium]
MRIERLGLDDLARLGGPRGVAAHIRSLIPSGADVERDVREIVAAVRERGDRAVHELTERFDGHDTAETGLVVAPQALDEAMAGLAADVYAGLEAAIANVAQVAAAGAQEDVGLRLAQGHRVNVRELPVGSAAVYVPGGRAPYPSTVVMGTVTARAAGVLDVVICSPPGAGGEVDPAVLAACRMCGVSRVYRMGGAQAIAALAYGTESVEAVDVIVGPGNLYVQEAKRQVSGVVGIDGFAGPSDLLVVLDDSVDANLAALDMLAQAEHGRGSLIVGVSASSAVLDVLAERLAALSAEYEVTRDAVCVLAETGDGRQAMALANALAPEHLELMGEEVEPLAPLAQSAGCLFVGTASATAFGDYVAGSNHVLPTAAAARFASGLSTRHFRRSMCEVRIDPESAVRLAALGAPIALSEGFPLHALSMRARAGGELPVPSGEGGAAGAGREG